MLTMVKNECGARLSMPSTLRDETQAIGRGTTRLPSNGYTLRTALGSMTTRLPDSLATLGWGLFNVIGQWCHQANPSFITRVESQNIDVFASDSSVSPMRWDKREMG